MATHREILQAGVMFLSLDAETFQAITERINDAFAELYPEGPLVGLTDDEVTLAAMARAIENCPE